MAYLLEPSVVNAPIITLPLFFTVTKPVFVTVAIAGLLVNQLMFLVEAVIGKIVAVSCNDLIPDTIFLVESS